MMQPGSHYDGQPTLEAHLGVFTQQGSQITFAAAFSDFQNAKTRHDSCP